MHIGSRICRTDRGAAIVEFALILPLLSMMALGMLTGGIALDRKQDINNSAREAARFGATVAEHECDIPADCAGLTWAQLVQSVAVQRSNNAVVAGNVCVALVSGDGLTPVAVSSGHTTAGGLNPCYVDNSSVTDKRVQVSVTKSGQLEAVLFKMTLNLGAKATARFET